MVKCKKSLLCGALAALLVVVGSVSADVIAPTADTYFLAENGGWIGGNNDQFLGVGFNPSGNERNAMMIFDLSAYDGMVIQSASLNVYKHSGGTYTQAPITVHRVTNEWTAYWACWNNRSNGVAWDTAGGDYDSAVVAGNGPSGNSPEGWYSLDVTSLVQDWADGTYANNGFFLDNAGTYVYIRSANYAGTTYDPYLSVDAVPEPVTLVMLGVGGLVAGLRRKR